MELIDVEGMFTREQFEALNPYARGYVVYLLGKDPEQPHVPDEENPYSFVSKSYRMWNKGMCKAILLAQDSP